MSNLLKVDFSSSDSYYACPLKYKLKHIGGWRKAYGNTALRFGSAFHAGMEGYYGYIAEHGWSRDGNAVQAMLENAYKDWKKETGERKFYPDYRTFENLVELMTKYIDHFYEDHDFLEVVHTERAFQLLIKPTEIDKVIYPDLEPFLFTGKLDLECILNGMNWTNEFKTTGWRLDQVVNELNRSPQVIGYAYAKNYVYKEPPEGCLVTVAFASARKVKSGDYGKLSLDFRRVPQIYNEHDLAKWRQHFISLVAQIQQSIRTGFFPPRFQSCYKYGRCEFLDLCEQACGIDEASFRDYEQEEPWDVTKEVAPEALMEGEEKDEDITFGSNRSDSGGAGEGTEELSHLAD